MAKATLIIITHNSARWIEPLVTSYRAAAPGANIKVIVADCASTDGTRDAVSRHWPEATFLALENIGYGAAANRAAALTNTDYLIIANADITFGPRFLAEVIHPLLQPLSELPAPPAWHGVACIAPKLLNTDGTTQDSVGIFPSVGKLLSDSRRPRTQRKYVQPQPTEPGMIDWATGACLIFRREVFNELGGFDEKFFLYVEEVDLQRRLWLSGRQTWFAPVVGGEVTHHAPLAQRPLEPQLAKWAVRGTIRYFAKHESAGAFLAVKLMGFAARRLSLSETLRSRRGWLEQSTK